MGSKYRLKVINHQKNTAEHTTSIAKNVANSKIFTYIRYKKFQQDKVLVRKFIETLFAEFSQRPKLCHVKALWKLNFLHILLNLSY